MCRNEDFVYKITEKIESQRRTTQKILNSWKSYFANCANCNDLLLFSERCKDIQAYALSSFTSIFVTFVKQCKYHTKRASAKAPEAPQSLCRRARQLVEGLLGRCPTGPEGWLGGLVEARRSSLKLLLTSFASSRAPREHPEASFYIVFTILFDDPQKSKNFYDFFSKFWKLNTELRNFIS